MSRLFNLPFLFPGIAALCFLAGCHKDTPADPVRAVTGDVRDIQENSAIVTGSVDLTDMELVLSLEWGFLISEDPDLPENDAEKYVCKTVFPDDQIMIQVERLSAGTTYYYAAFVHILGKSWTGDVKSFKTPGNPIPPGAVDIGLSVYWADRNVGASLPGEQGASLTWDDMTALPLESSWRIPEPKDFEELSATFMDSGYLWNWKRVDDACFGWEILFRKNGNRVFLPCPENSSSVYGRGLYLSSSISDYDSQAVLAWSLSSGAFGVGAMMEVYGYYGYLVRTVSDKY
jgi:hypothetical protein